MTDISENRTFHDPNPERDTPVSAGWFTALNRFAFDIFSGAETKAEARAALNIEDGATADQSAAEIKAAYESNADTNAFTDAEVGKLGGIESAATADQSDAEIEAAYNTQVDVVAQAEAEAGTATTVRRWTAQRVGQAITALSSGAAVAVSQVVGLVVTRPSVATVRIRCRDAILRDASGALYRTGPVDVTVDITTSGAEGLDTGSEASDTIYTVFLIYNGTTVSAVLSTAAAVTGTTDGTTADKLVDSGETFETKNVQVGAWVRNTTDDTVTRVSAVDSETVLSLEDDVFASGEAYFIGQEKPTLPSGYTYWSCPLTYVENDSSGDLVDIQQKGNRIDFKAARTIATGLNSATYAAQDINGTVPAFTGYIKDVLYGAKKEGATAVTFYISVDGTNAATYFQTNTTGPYYIDSSANPDFVAVTDNLLGIQYKVTEATGTTLYARAYRLNLPLS